MLALYLVTLGASAGLVGAFAHHVLADVGFAPTFQAALTITGVAVCGYLSAQLLYAGLVQLAWPTRDRAFYLAEVASHISALLLLPFLLQMYVDWPHPAMARFEPLVYGLGFALAHAVLKLASFYAATQGKPAPRWAAVGWLGACTLFAMMAYGTGRLWWEASQNQRPQLIEILRHYRDISDSHANRPEIPRETSPD